MTHFQERAPRLREISGWMNPMDMVFLNKENEMKKFKNLRLLDLQQSFGVKWKQSKETQSEDMIVLKRNSSLWQL